MQKSKTSSTFLVLIILMSILPLISTDIYLPAFPDVVKYFSTTPEAVQGTLGTFLFGISITQLVYGPLSDTYGRKKVLLAGILIYLIATIGCLISGSIHQMLIWRFLQGAGICAGTVISKAIITDLYDAKASARIYTTIFPFIGCSPAIAPVIGGHLATLGGWKLAFGCLLLLSILLFIGIAFLLKETNKKETQRHFSLIQTISNYKTLLSSRYFVGYTTVVCCGYGAWFAYISASSFIFKSLHLSASAIGYFYIPLSVTYVIANLSGKKLLNKIKMDTLIIFGMLLFLIGCLSMLYATHNEISDPTSIIISMSIIAGANGFLLPLGTSSGLSIEPKIAGTASGLLGFLQLGFASLCASLVGHITDGEPFQLSIVLILIAFFLFATYIGLIVKPKFFTRMEKIAD